ncbi:hypothetical protein Catovirus_1_573 [Catovirus CTV1]|uniref:Uncharacterized protein n=1 Tax=Catovirus CTV1 TaxID=1977631 RepID=A0A1V0SA00_9VIRU|nr:hypothetical protein Catovirus_1_573 [Catovirus CTV1]
MILIILTNIKLDIIGDKKLEKKYFEKYSKMLDQYVSVLYNKQPRLLDNMKKMYMIIN